MLPNKSQNDEQKNCLSHRSQPTDLPRKVPIFDSDSIVKINMACRTGRCVPVYSLSSVEIFLRIQVYSTQSLTRALGKQNRQKLNSMINKI